MEVFHDGLHRVHVRARGDARVHDRGCVHDDHDRARVDVPWVFLIA